MTKEWDTYCLSFLGWDDWKTEDTPDHVVQKGMDARYSLRNIPGRRIRVLDHEANCTYALCSFRMHGRRYRMWLLRHHPKKRSVDELDGVQ